MMTDCPNGVSEQKCIAEQYRGSWKPANNIDASIKLDENSITTVIRGEIVKYFSDSAYTINNILYIVMPHPNEGGLAEHFELGTFDDEAGTLYTPAIYRLTFKQIGT